MALEQFPTLIPTLQSTKIIDFLEELRENGEIDSDIEYTDLLKKLLTEITSDSSTFVPLFKRVPFKAGRSASALYNFQLDQLHRDIEVIFLELANISTVLKSHSEVIKDKYIDQIRFTLKDLKTKIDNLQVIKSSSSGLSDVSYSTFTDAGQLLPRSDSDASALYQDSQKLTFIQDSQLGLVDRNEEVLSLPLDNGNEIPFLKVDIDRTNTTVSEKDINLTDSGPENILDSQLGSFWYYNVLTKEALPNGAQLTLHLDLGDKKEVNSLTLESISEFPMYIENIQYIDEFDVIRSLETDLDNRTLAGSRKFVFTPVFLRKVIVTLKQFNVSFFSLDKNAPSFTIDDLKRNTSLQPNVALLSDSIQASVEDPNVQAVLPIAQPLPLQYEVYHHYTFGMDNAFMGTDIYNNDGYFVTKPVEVIRLGQVALEVEEIIRDFHDEDLDDEFLSGSLEYELIKKDFNGKGDLIGTVALPLLPLGQLIIENERLFFSSSRNIISLRFPGHTTDYDASNVIIFRNNQELVRGVDWRLANRSNPGDDSDSLVATLERTTRIEILHADNVIANGIYTVRYTPQHILNPEAEIYKDLQSTILYLPNGNIEFKIDRVFEVPEISKLFLRIAIRNNSFFKYLTPKLKSYKLFHSST